MPARAHQDALGVVFAAGAEAQVNIRIMVPDVDAYWARARATGAPIFAAIADREYGLRDFTILDPDGVGLRFGTRLRTPARKS